MTVANDNNPWAPPVRPVPPPRPTRPPAPTPVPTVDPEPVVVADPPVSESEDLGELTKPELQQRAADLDLPTSGTKADLIERIQAAQGTPA